MSVCPLQTLGVGTWQLKATDRVLQGSNDANMIGVEGQSYSGARQYFQTAFDASRSSSTYQNNAPVQQDAYLVNIWERIS